MPFTPKAPKSSKPTPKLDRSQVRIEGIAMPMVEPLIQPGIAKAAAFTHAGPAKLAVLHPEILEPAKAHLGDSLTPAQKLQCRIPLDLSVKEPIILAMQHERALNTGIQTINDPMVTKPPRMKDQMTLRTVLAKDGVCGFIPEVIDRDDIRYRDSGEQAVQGSA
ncbi:MAG: hypothetical protein VKK97_08720 [Synechococcaceae cyanobacterium]|nr:hypothetical protein [Synechococcaceae cyanobacterium]